MAEKLDPARREAALLRLNGWIYDPKDGKAYDVEIRLQAPDRLQVKGYLGIKMLSETFVWQRAPTDLPRCPA